MRRLVLLFGIALTLSAQYQDRFKDTWIEPGSGGILPEFDAFDSIEGTLGVLNASGPVNTDGHPFFTRSGNQRASLRELSSADLRDERFHLRACWSAGRTTDGKDPVFAAFDGSNCPGLPQDKESSHSLLLKRGLFRIPLPWPPKNADGSPKPVEFTIEVVRDPTGCNTSPQYGLKSADPTISVYRRPRPAANLKYVISGGQPIVLKTGMLADVDPETGNPVSMNLMSDAREPSLKTQALSAIMGHEQATVAPSREQIEKIVEFESQVYVGAGGAHLRRPSGGRRADLRRWGRPRCAIIGPACSAITTTIRSSGSSLRGRGTITTASSVARGADIFMYPPVLAARCGAHQLHRLGQPAEAHLRHLPQRANDRPGSFGRMGRCRHHELSHLDRTCHLGGIERTARSSRSPALAMPIRILTWGASSTRRIRAAR